MPHAPRAVVAIMSIALMGVGCATSPAPRPTPVPDRDACGTGGACPSGYTCIQECGPPVVRENDPPPGYYCEKNDIAAQPRNCPICLASTSRIATPAGEVAVTDVRVGDVVWTRTLAGERVAAPVLRVGSTPVPAGHTVVRIVLEDTRTVRVSAPHPTGDGRLVGDLVPGDAFDGSVIVSVDREAYDGVTYDLLPAGDTGAYWADGILLGSTLSL